MVQPKICDHYSVFIVWLATSTALHSSYHIGEPSINPKLLLPCVYDAILYDYAVLLLISLLLYIYVTVRFATRPASKRATGFEAGRPASKPADRITTVSSTSARFEAGQTFGKRVSTRFVAGRARSTRFATGVVYRSLAS